MDKDSLRLECLELAVQVATAEAVEGSRKAPSLERVAVVAKGFYDFVIEGTAAAGEVGDLGEVPGALVPLAPQVVKKPSTEKDSIFK